ncbi:MAG: DegT/DnrJ/EryC1/StrS family aminotransferase [Holosporales bacterium]|jgi:dTDP-4-amino-4,6-dideoxygalactose transaminase|nr:DegT/DnrJ/EryC1/StrS family aminotransferase [Holosporales bacterium]
MNMKKCAPKIRLSSPWFGDEEIAAVSRVLCSNRISMGNEVKQFECELHSFFGRKDTNISCVSSCTAAIQLAIQASGFVHGDEILVPTYTFVATFQAITAAGTRPVPCDIDLDDGFINIDDARSRTTGKTTAILPVLFAGCDGKIGRLQQFAEDYGLKIIEDAAHSFGDENISLRNSILCFSFDAIKNISCGDGGAILTPDDEIAEKIKDIRLLGVIGDTDRRFNGERSWDFDVTEQGWRYHMNDLSAAIGRAQLAKFQAIKQIRCSIARTYVDRLAHLNHVRLLPINFRTAVPHIFPIIIKNGKRDELKRYLERNGIETGVQYKPNHLLSFFNLGYDLPKAMELYNSILSIPIHPLLSESDVIFIIECIKKFFYD